MLYVVDVLINTKSAIDSALSAYYSYITVSIRIFCATSSFQAEALYSLFTNSIRLFSC